VLNNQAGRTSAAPGWYQRIIKEDNGTVSFEYNWGGNASTVKGYPAIVAGWHYGGPVGYLTATGSKSLPVRISAQKLFNSGISASHVNSNYSYEKMSLSWNIWIAASDKPSVPSKQIMIWVWRKNQVPIGSKVGTVSMWGTNWDLYSGKAPVSPYWGVYTFVRQTTTLATSGNLRDFVNYLWKTKGWLSSSQWIVGIECGTELIQGKGKWNISRYWLTP
jgi:hypothetical protein